MAETLSGKFLSELDNLSTVSDIKTTDYLLMSHTAPGGSVGGSHLISYSVSVDTMARKFGDVINSLGNAKDPNHLLKNYGFAVDVEANRASIATNTGNIAANAARIDVHDLQITTHTANIVDHQSKIDYLSGAIDDNHTDILSNRTDIDLNTAKIKSLSSYITTNIDHLTAHDSDIGALRMRVTTNETNIANNTSNIAEHQRNIDYLSAQVSGNADSIAEHQLNINYLSGQVDACSRIGHTHTIADVTGLQTALDDKSNVGHRHKKTDIEDLGSSLDGCAPAVHTHAIADVNNLQSTLDDKSDVDHKHDTLYSKLGHDHDTLYSRIGHKHICADITDFPSIQSGARIKYSAGKINYAAKSGKVTSGFVPFFKASDDCIVTCSVTLGTASGCGNNNTARRFQLKHDGAWEDLVPPNTGSASIDYSNVTLMLKAGDELQVSGYCSNHPSYYQYSASYLTRT